MRLLLTLPLLVITFICISQASATNLTVNFTATIKETTCAMTVTPVNGSNISGDTTSNNYYLDLPIMGISDIYNMTPLTEGSFKILPSNCNNYVSGLSMTIKGAVSSYTDSLIANDQSIAGHTNYVGMGIKRMNSDESLRFKLNGNQRIDWTRDEIINGIDLTALIRRTTSSQPTSPGDFQAKATFVFTYQ